MHTATNTITTSATITTSPPLQVVRDMYAAWEANDADALVELYTADATVVRPGSFEDGREEVRTAMAAAFAGPFRNSRPIDTTHSVRLYGEDTAIVIGVAGVLLAGEHELPTERLRRATWTLVRENGRWLIAAYHNCATS